MTFITSPPNVTLDGISIPLFTGLNYTLWRAQVDIALMSHKVYLLTTGGADNDTREFREKRQKAVSILLATVDEPALADYGWKRDTEKYMRQNGALDLLSEMMKVAVERNSAFTGKR